MSTRSEQTLVAPDLSSARVLTDWFARGLAGGPDTDALRIGPRSYSYRWLHERALALAGDLVAVIDPARTSGARPPRVGVLAARSAQAYAAVLAAGYAGAAFVPLHPHFPAERTGQMILAADLDAVLVDDDGAAVLPELAAELGRIPVVREPVGPPLAAPRPGGPDDVAYILFTSGSTGRPKGVPVLQRNVDAYLRFVHARYGFTASDVFSQTFDLTFDLSVFDMFTAWGSGGTLVSTPARAFSALPRFLAEQGITVWFSSPSVIALVRTLTGLEPGALAGLRWSLFCGEPLLTHDAADWQAAAPGSHVENLYGPTELTISCSVHRWDPEVSPQRAVNDIVSIGTMHPGMHYLLHDPEGEPGRATGELCVRGSQMFPGYLDAGDDEGRFVVTAGRRWYRTGDLVREIDGGELAYLGRRDSQVKIRGVRVELAEVEWALRRVRGIRDAVAVAIDGELVAFYVGERRPMAEIAEELGHFLPKAIVPRRFRALEEFPLNANRKTDRKALVALLS